MTAHKRLAATITKADADAGTFTAVASAPTLDRDGEVVDPFAFEPLPESVPVHDGHFFDRVVARARPRYDTKGVLYVDGRFSSIPDAQRTRTLVREGVIDSMSVAFHDPVRKPIDGVPHITRAELLAVDFVSVPSNREARVVAVRGFGGPAVFDAKMIALRAQLDLLEVDLLDTRAKAAQPGLLPNIYADLADLQSFLADLNRR